MKPPTGSGEQSSELRDSFTAVLLTALEYVANDLRKKWKQFMMGVITVFLTVSFITFLGGIGSLGPITTLKTAMFHAGDFDVMFKSHSDAKPWKIGNTNYYNDDNDFFNAPYLSKSDKVSMSASQNLKQMNPSINFTQLDEKANRIYDKVANPPIELFPRWIAQTTLFNPNNVMANTSAHMIAGDSYLERKINVAPEFPKMLPERNEIITSGDVMRILDLKEGQSVEAHVSHSNYS